MSKDYEIHITGSPFEWSPWCSEKSEATLRGIAAFLDRLRANPNATDDILELADNLQGALWNGTKLLAFSCGATWSVEDAGRILDGGTAALEELLVKYGIEEETSPQRAQRVKRESADELRNQARDFIARFRDFLQLEREFGRPGISDLFVRFGRRKSGVVTLPYAEQLNDLTDEVLLGNIPWNEYVTRAQDKLTQWEEVLDNSEA